MTLDRLHPEPQTAPAQRFLPAAVLLEDAREAQEERTDVHVDEAHLGPEEERAPGIGGLDEGGNLLVHVREMLKLLGNVLRHENAEVRRDDVAIDLVLAALRPDVGDIQCQPSPVRYDEDAGDMRHPRDSPRRPTCGSPLAAAACPSEAEPGPCSAPRSVNVNRESWVSTGQRRQPQRQQREQQHQRRRGWDLHIRGSRYSRSTPSRHD